MGEKIQKISIVLLLALSVLFSFSFPGKAQAAGKINFSQSILPVKFVYLDARGGIEKVWSNVAPADDLYAVKFFDAQRKNELPENQEFLGKYFNYAEKQNKCEFFSNGKINRIVEYKKSGNAFEEIQTVV